MREVLFTPEFHLAVFALFSFIICLVVTCSKIITNAKKIDKLEALSKISKWEEIKVDIEEYGYFIHYPYPHSYTRSYGRLSELQAMKASSFELESYKNRLKKEKIEVENGYVTVFYRAEDGKLRNRISVSNNHDLNYNFLISSDRRSVAYRNKANPKLVVLRIPDDQEVKMEKGKAMVDSVKSISIYITLASIFCIAALSV